MKDVGLCCGRPHLSDLWLNFGFRGKHLICHICWGQLGCSPESPARGLAGATTRCLCSSPSLASSSLPQIFRVLPASPRGRLAGTTTKLPLPHTSSDFIFRPLLPILCNSMKLWAMLCRATQDGGSWWRALKKSGPLENGMANHFSILGLRTPWTV